MMWEVPEGWEPGLLGRREGRLFRAEEVDTRRDRQGQGGRHDGGWLQGMCWSPQGLRMGVWEGTRVGATWGWGCAHATGEAGSAARRTA